MWKTQWRPENEERPVEDRDVGQTMTNGTTHRPSGAEETLVLHCVRWGPWMTVSRGGTWSGSNVNKYPQASQEKIDCGGWGGGQGLEARHQGGGDCRQDIVKAGLGGGCEWSEARWGCGYTWKVEPSRGTDRSDVGGRGQHLWISTRRIGKW